VKKKNACRLLIKALDVLKLQFLELKKTKGEEKSISLCLGRDTERKT
jgi:hypothetical protein